MPFAGFYKGKRVLVTGHTGFKGSWLALWLVEQGATVIGYSLPPPTTPNHFETVDLEQFIKHVIGDVTDYEHLLSTVTLNQPDIVFHLAAQSLVREGVRNPRGTFLTNIQGTVNILDVCRVCGGLPVVCITSDKCYENQEWLWGYRENDKLGGKEPYSVSKACAEMAISCYRGLDQWRLIASARAGNVIGGGDWSKDRLVPDVIRAIMEDRAITIRNPESTRPWQHVLDALSGYLWLGYKLMAYQGPYAASFNFGPPLSSPMVPVRTVVQEIVDHWSKDGSKPKVVYEDGDNKECGLLRLDCSKANSMLNWKPAWNLKETLYHTAYWYKAFYGTSDATKSVLSLAQIENYTRSASNQKIQWAVED